MALPLLLFLFLSASLFFLTRRINNHGKVIRKPSLPPGPSKLPFVGNLPLLRQPLHRLLWQLSKQHGPLMHLQLGSVSALVISSAEMAKHFLKTHDHECCSRPALAFTNKLTYGGSDMALSPYNKQWRELRKISSLELLSHKKVLSLRAVREEEVNQLISSIANFSADGLPVNLTDVVTTFANIAVTRMALGRSYKSFRVHELLSETSAIANNFFVADFFPKLGWLDLLTGLQARLEKLCARLDCIYEELIREHMDPQRGKDDILEDILDTLLAIHKYPSKNLTLNNIKGVLVDIFLRGTDTSSAAIEWAMTELMRNPRVMEKAKNEVRSMVGSKGKVEETDIPHLPYLKMIIKETLRLRPPVPLLLQREVISPFKVDQYDIEPKTRLIINEWAISREEAQWEKPEEFWLERFEDGVMDRKGQDFQLIPFGAGRRICPGMNMGMAVVGIALANLLYAFNWDVLPGTRKEDVDVEEGTGITMRKKNPLILMASANRYTDKLEVFGTWVAIIGKSTVCCFVLCLSRWNYFHDN